MANEQPSGSKSTPAPDKPPEPGTAPPPVAASRSGAPSSSAMAAPPRKKKRKKFPVKAIIPVIAALIAAIAAIIVAVISKPSPSSPNPSITASTASSTPGPLAPGDYTISTSALGYLGYLELPDPNGTGLVEGCENDQLQLCWNEPDVQVKNQGSVYHHNQDWKIMLSGASYVIQSEYDGGLYQGSQGLSFPPACDRLVSVTNPNNISYGFLMIMPKCSTPQANNISQGFHNISDSPAIIPVAGGYEIKNSVGLCLTAIAESGGGSYGGPTHTRFQECQASGSGHQAWTMNQL